MVKVPFHYCRSRHEGNKTLGSGFDHSGVMKEIADHFRRSLVTVSEAIAKVEEHIPKDKAFARELKLLSENLSKGRKRKYRITEA